MAAQPPNAASMSAAAPSGTSQRMERVVTESPGVVDSGEMPGGRAGFELPPGLGECQAQRRDHRSIAPLPARRRGRRHLRVLALELQPEITPRRERRVEHRVEAKRRGPRAK